MAKKTQLPTESGTYHRGSSEAKMDQSEREERHTARRRLKSAYLNIIGDNTEVIAGDLATVRIKLERIEEAWRNRRQFTRAEVNRLSAMRTKWTRRLNGEDAKYTTRGNKRGRPHQEENDNRARLQQTYTCVKGIKTWVEKFDADYQHLPWQLRRLVTEKE